MPGKKYVVDEKGRGRLVDQTDIDRQAVAAQKEIVAAERPGRLKKMIDARADHVVAGVIPVARQADLAMVLAEAAGKAPGYLTPKETKARQVRAWIKTVEARSDALQAAVEQGKAVNIKDGTIDGAGSWPSPPQ